MFDEEKFKVMAAEQNQCSTTAGEIGGYAKQAMGLDTDAPSMRQRIKSQLRRANQESRKANALAELEYLLDKNPEVARILDLLEQVGR